MDLVLRPPEDLGKTIFMSNCFGAGYVAELNDEHIAKMEDVLETYRRPLVSAFLADSIQQIHSLRASGVISSHAVNACGSEVRAFFKSAGIWCTTPPEIFFCDMDKLSFGCSRGVRI